MLEDFGIANAIAFATSLIALAGVFIGNRQCKAAITQARATLEAAITQAQATLDAGQHAAEKAAAATEKSLRYHLYAGRRNRLDVETDICATAVASLYTAAVSGCPTKADVAEVVRQATLLFFHLEYPTDSPEGGRHWTSENAACRTKIWKATEEIQELILKGEPVPAQLSSTLQDNFRLLKTNVLDARD